MKRTAAALLSLATIVACSKPPAGPFAAPCVTGGPANPLLDGATFAPALKVDLACTSHSASGLYYRDIMIGTGAEVKTGTQASVKYDGTLVDGARFDAGTYPVNVGAHRVIPGWDEGLVGMRVGGVRQLIIPPDLAYGAEGRPPAIPPSSILVFTVEILSAQ